MGLLDGTREPEFGQDEQGSAPAARPGFEELVAEVRRQTDRMVEAALQGASDQASERYRQFEESIGDRLRTLLQRHRALREEWDAFGAELVECLGAIAAASASHRVTTDDNPREDGGAEWPDQLEHALHQS